MIRILGQLTAHASKRDELTAALPAQWAEAWRARHGAAKNEQQAAQSLAALALLCRMHPTGTLAYDTLGRPYFLEGDADFSITHTEGACFCALSCGTDRIGLDAEHPARAERLNVRDMAERWLTPAERQAWEKNPTAAHFLRIWTRKEALVKRSGEGLRALHAADSTATDVRFFEACEGDILLTLAHAGEREVRLEWV